MSWAIRVNIKSTKRVKNSKAMDTKTIAKIMEMKDFGAKYLNFQVIFLKRIILYLVFSYNI